jgi:hypothetical protein
MRIVRQIGLLLVVVGAFSAVAASNALAGTPLFLSHGTGKLSASAGTSVQTLTTALGKIECNKAALTEGATTALRQLTLSITVQYSACKAGEAGEAIVHPVKYLIDANGLVKLVTTAIILIPGIPSCVVTLPSAKNQALENAVTFDNNTANKGLLILVKAEKITSFGSGGCLYNEESTGTAVGTLHVTVAGGTLKWDLNA